MLIIWKIIIEEQKQTSKSRKNNHSLSNWSFYRLAQYIEYKAKDRQYKCSNCGHTDHRDIVGAKNIIHAPVLDGHSQVA